MGDIWDRLKAEATHIWDTYGYEPDLLRKAAQRGQELEAENKELDTDRAMMAIGFEEHIAELEAENQRLREALAALQPYCFNSCGDTHMNKCNGCNQWFDEEAEGEGANEHAQGCPVATALGRGDE